jgi:hypothetical protein
MRKVLLAVCLVLGGFAVFVLGNPYYTVFPTNQNQVFMLALTIIWIVIALAFKKIPILYPYWSSAYALLIAACVILFLKSGVMNVP